MLANFSTTIFPTFQDSFNTLVSETSVYEINFGGRIIPQSLVASNDAAVSLVNAIKVIQIVTNVLVPTLDKLTPSGAADLNEADLNEPNWQQVFYGENYAKLPAIRQMIRTAFSVVRQS
ncbi:hypothetical protein F4805DRAFT_453554 [Annulohypoxylon moriforme]|nr:hypothetical protein F4805DRAFT_453554 [Annulohypoxylon moriforme]